jgi:phosphoribosylformylglycinamidine synthase
MGDPFLEKLLIEATLEALASGDVVGIQDMGAAGLTCSTCETAAKACTGMQIDILKVPRREAGMSAYEVMLSESQERMLAICKQGAEDRVAAIFRKWGLNAVVVGRVTDDGLVRVTEGEKVVAEVRAKSLTDECPTYQLDAAEPAYLAEIRAFDPLKALAEAELSGSPNLQAGPVLRRLLASPTIASKEWVTTQYDSMVQTQTVLGPGAGDAAVLKIRGTTRGIAMKTDGNGRYCYLDPYTGGAIAVAEAARNVACVGARPAAVTDCLNFANPEKPTGFWQFRKAVEGIAAATEALQTPVVSGNVSFYNETPEGPIYPTPVIGMLGVLDDIKKRVGSAFRAEGDAIVLLRADEDPTGGLGGSEFLSLILGVESGAPPRIDLAAEKRLQDCLLSAIRQGLIVSAHDCSDGGLGVCLAESAIAAGLGAAVLLRSDRFAGLPIPAILFGEAQSRVVVTLTGERGLPALEKVAETFGVRAEWIGTVGADRLRIAVDGSDVADEPVAELARIYGTAIRAIMQPA